MFGLDPDEGLAPPPHEHVTIPIAAIPDEPTGLSQPELLAWQEARRQSRARNDGARSDRRLVQVVTDNLDTPLALSSLRVLGTESTRASFLSSLFTPLLISHVTSQEDGTYTLESLLTLSQAIQASVAPFDIFKECNVRLEPATSLLEREGAVDLVVDVKEKNRFNGTKVGVEVGQQDGGANAGLKVRNVFGGAETLSITGSTATKTRMSLEAELRAPLFTSPIHSLSLAAHMVDRDNSTFASHWEHLQGAKITYEARTQLGGHAVSYEASQRTLSQLAPLASVSIREAALKGPTLKSALAHTYVRDSRDTAFLGTRGWLCKVTQELAGLGGNAFHAKATTETALSRALGGGFYGSFVTRTGIVFPLSKSTGTHLSDRLFLGGPTSVRGFTTNGMGPRDGEDALGGDLAYSLGLSILGPLPGKPDWPLKVHGYLNAGKLASIDSRPSTLSPSASSSYRASAALAPLLATPPSVSAGFGLAYTLGAIRLEVNYNLPLVAGRGEGRARGLGVAMGIDYL